MRKGGTAELLQANGVGGRFFHQFSESVNVTTGKDEIKANGSD
jgi:hypothetical protein